MERDTILTRLAVGPVQYADLAGDKGERGGTWQLMQQLRTEGLVRIVQIERFPHFVLKDWVMPNEMRLSIIEGNSKMVDGCMVWQDYVEPDRGPTTRFGTEAPVTVRRMIWQIKRGPLKYQETVRMAVTCHPNCVDYTHMSRGFRHDLTSGKPRPLTHRQRIARTQQERIGKLDWDKVREIRASQDTERVLSERFGVSRPTIGQVRRGETWRETGARGMFTNLIREAA